MGAVPYVDGNKGEKREHFSVSVGTSSFQTSDSQGIIPLHLAGYELKSEPWGFVCLGFLFVLEVDLKQKKVERGKCSVNVSYCGPTVALNEL